ncbi:ATP-binding cassette domain-containing protein [Sciscionella sediminilitoris]|uniref:ATP-binding cassette domain-containing protein n=1 Tax=Sciscionella sediminilitoris TaxID=1445613 RepID=UPI0006907E78|nr:ATP-binding cassette domain-containing protein [Sciscionella sp. SE31]
MTATMTRTRAGADFVRLDRVRATTASAGVTVTLEQGAATALFGGRGRGKTSLLRCIAGIDAPVSGAVLVDGLRIGALSPARRTALRRTQIGYCGANPALAPALSVWGNVVAPARLAGAEPDPGFVGQVLERCGLAGFAARGATGLAPAQRGMLSLARAMVCGGKLVLVDEPERLFTSTTAIGVMDFLRSGGKTVIFATGDRNLSEYADNVVDMESGWQRVFRE